MKFKTFDLIVYRHNDETLLSFDIKGGRIPLSKLLHIPKGKPFKMKITPEIVEKYRIKQEIKQSQMNGKSPEGLYFLAEEVEKGVEAMYRHDDTSNWHLTKRVFAYKDIYDVAFNRGIRHERQRRKTKHKALTAFDIIGADDVAELSHELGVSEARLMHAVLEVIAKRKNGGME